MTVERDPALEMRFGGCFHQDWDLAGEDWPAAVAGFRRDASLGDARAAAEGIDRLLADTSSDAELAAVVHDGYGCMYDPRPELGGPTVREWLRRVSAALRADGNQELA